MGIDIFLWFCTFNKQKGMVYYEYVCFYCKDFYQCFCIYALHLFCDIHFSKNMIYYKYGGF